MPRAIIDLEDYTESKNILEYGDTGVGKTAQLGTLPGRVLLIATETGTVTIRRFMKRYGLKPGKVKVWPVHKWDDLVEAYKYLAERAGDWDWVAVDSATNMQQLALRAILNKAVVENPNRDEDIPAIQDHQKWQNMFKRFVTDFNELPVNVLWTATAMRREDQEGEDLTLPAIQGKDYEIAAWVCAQMHVVAFYGKKVQGKGDKAVLIRRLLFEGVPPYFAKDRYGVFPRFVTISKGEEQVTTLGELVQKIDEDPKAIDRARNAMEAEEEEAEAEARAALGADADEDADEDEDEDEETEESESAEDPDAEINGTVAEDENEEEEEPDEEEDDTDSEDDDGNELEDDEDDETDDERDEAEEALWDERRTELLEMKKAALKAAVDEAGLKVADLKGLPLDEVVEKIIDAEKAAFDAAGADDESDDDEDDDLDAEDLAPEPPAKKAAPKKTAAKTATKRARI